MIYNQIGSEGVCWGVQNQTLSFNKTRVRFVKLEHVLYILSVRLPQNVSQVNTLYIYYGGFVNLPLHQNSPKIRQKCPKVVF